MPALQVLKFSQSPQLQKLPGGTLMNSPHSYRDDHVWSVENKTSRLLFASERDAYEYVRSFAASVGGGMVVSKLPVYRIASSSDATSRGTE